MALPHDGFRGIGWGQALDGASWCLAKHADAGKWSVPVIASTFLARPRASVDHGFPTLGDV